MCAGIALLPTSARAETASAQVSYADSRSLDVALFYPDGLKLIRGVVVFTGGQKKPHSPQTNWAAAPDNGQTALPSKEAALAASVERVEPGCQPQSA